MWSSDSAVVPPRAPAHRQLEADGSRYAQRSGCGAAAAGRGLRCCSRCNAHAATHTKRAALLVTKPNPALVTLRVRTATWATLMDGARGYKGHRDIGAAPELRASASLADRFHTPTRRPSRSRLPCRPHPALAGGVKRYHRCHSMPSHRLSPAPPILLSPLPAQTAAAPHPATALLRA